MHRLHLLLPLALVMTVLAFPVSAQAVIVPQHSIAGVRLNMSERAVRAKLGAPLRFRKGTNIFGHWRRLDYPRVTIAFQNGDKATFVQTKSAKEKTASGIGVGSTRAQVRSSLSGENCKREFGAFHCWLGRWDPGRVITEFRFKDSRVTQVAIGYVVD